MSEHEWFNFKMCYLAGWKTVFERVDRCQLEVHLEDIRCKLAVVWQAELNGFPHPGVRVCFFVWEKTVTGWKNSSCWSQSIDHVDLNKGWWGGPEGSISKPELWRLQKLAAKRRHEDDQSQGTIFRDIVLQKEEVGTISSCCVLGWKWSEEIGELQRHCWLWSLLGTGSLNRSTLKALQN